MLNIKLSYFPLLECALKEGRIFIALFPLFLNPLDFLPADVNPLKTLLLFAGFESHERFLSEAISGLNGSTIITS